MHMLRFIRHARHEGAWRTEDMVIYVYIANGRQHTQRPGERNGTHTHTDKGRRPTRYDGTSQERRYVLEYIDHSAYIVVVSATSSTLPSVQGA